MRRAALLLLAACSVRPETRAPRVEDPTFEIVRLEGTRTGAPRLLELVRSGAPSPRARALRALGREGDEANVETIVAWLGDADAQVASAAAEALGLIGAASAEPALRAMLAARPSVALVEALGRVGADGESARALAKLLGSSDASLRAAAARALGALGQRKQPVPDDALAALVGAAGDASVDVRYAVAYALFRARGDEALLPPAKAALERLGADADAETRAMAVRALAAHQAASQVFATALADDDWRVRVQAVRALAKDGADTRAVLAGWTAHQLQDDAKLWSEPRAHAVLEAFTLLAPFATEPNVTPLFKGAVDLLKPQPETLTRNIAFFQALAGLARLGAVDVGVLLQDGDKWGYPVHERARLAVEIVAEKKSVASSRAWQLVQELSASKDARVRAAAVGAIVALLPDAKADAMLVAALHDPDAIVVGSVADALTAKDAPRATDAILFAAAEALVVAKDPEIAEGLVNALCLAPERASAYTDALRRAHAHPNVAVRAAARTCLTKILGADPGPGVASAPEPATPADPTRLLGHRVTWTVTTTQGAFVVELLPELAPWNVGTVTALAEKRFYDDTLWHRVVPDFVVQGGDPTGSGWGGPGYSVPAETSQRRYRRGTVGIADAGKDTGGSQWFVMHSAAPHLEQRYTIVGEVTSGMEVVDRLNVGDRIVHVEVKISP